VTITFGAASLIAFLLALARTAPWVILTPPFTALPLPMMVQTGIAAALAFLAMPTVQAAGSLPTNTPEFIGAIVLQILVGCVMGMVLKTLFTAFEAAGSISDLFGGIVLPPAMDPLSENQVPKLGQLYQLVAVMLLFASGGYLLVVKGFVTSFRALPPSIGSLGMMSQVLTSDFATLFVSALEIAAPVLVIMFATQVLLGMLSKAAPQANILMLGFPIQVTLALVSIALAIRVLPTSVDTMVQRMVIDAAHVAGL
jgi:flagellar biosynthetic protein FliR